MTTRDFLTLTGRANYYNMSRAAIQGLLLPRASAAALEEALLVNVTDVLSRARLLGYYSKLKGKISHAHLNAKLNHILWFIKHAPDCIFAGDLYLSFDKVKYPEYYGAVRGAWEREIARRGSPLHAKVNAALFAFKSEPKWSARLLRSILREAPDHLWAIRGLSQLDVLVDDVQKRLPLSDVPANYDYEAWRIYSDQVHLQTMVFHGAQMPSMSALTLEAVLRKYPSDLNARAELIGYYGNRCVRQNVFGVDPDVLNHLAAHLIWFVQHVPGSSFVGASFPYPVLDSKLARKENAVLSACWMKVCEQENASSSAILNAYRFLIHHGQSAFAAKLVTARRVSRATADREKQETIRLRKWFANKNTARRTQESILDTLYMEPGRDEQKAPKAGYELIDWVEEIDLCGAHLEGVYHWVPPLSISNLEEFMAPDSCDVYNRAKVVGSYDAYYGRVERWKNRKGQVAISDKQRNSYFEHVKWFIENVPQSRFLVLVHLSCVMKADRKMYKSIVQLLRHAIKKQDQDLGVLISAAAALSLADRETSQRFADRVERFSPEWHKRLTLLTQRKKGKDHTPAPYLKKYSFEAGKRSKAVSRAATTLDLTGQTLWARRCSSLMAWSSEYALVKNPADLVLRAELLEVYDHQDQFSVSFLGHTPDVIPQLLKHNLWFIQHIPDQRIYSLGCNLALDGLGPGESHYGPQAVLLAAAKQQLRAYPNNVAIGLTMSSFHRLGDERAQLRSLQRIKELYPNNRQLKRHLEFLDRMLDTRNDAAIRKKIKLSRRSKSAFL